MKDSKPIFCIVVMAMVCLLGVTGCWDNNELNDVAFIIGTGLDKIGKGAFSASVQIADPTEQQGGSEGKAGGSKGYRVETADGKDLSDALANLQNNLPRHLIIGHRQAIVIGEELARDGIGSYLDEIVRNPKNSLRTDVFIIRGGTAKQFLENKYAFETFSALAAGEQQKLLSTNETTLRNFLFDAMGEPTSSTLPVIDMTPRSNLSSSDDEEGQKTPPAFSLNGTALFNRKLQLIGLLSNEQSFLYLWGVNKLQHITLSEPIDSSGNLISLEMSQLHSSVRVKSIKGQTIAQISLHGTGRIVENHTKFSPSKLGDIEVIQQRLNQIVSDKMHRLILKTQGKYQADVFRFGEEMHRTYPSEWQHIKTNWPQIFPKLKVEVNVGLHVLHGGEISTGDIFAG